MSVRRNERGALLDATPHYVHTGGKENDGQKHKSREQSGGHGTLEFDAATIAQHAAHERAEGARARRRTRDKRRATRRRQRDEEAIYKAADERTIAFIVISLFPPDICWLDIWFIRSTSNDRRGTSLQHGTH